MRIPPFIGSCVLAAFATACNSSEELEAMTEGVVGAPEVSPCEEAPEGMVCVEGGVFDRGASNVPECSGTQPGNDSLPVEPVWVQTTFMDTHEVRWSDYERCVSAGFCDAPEGLLSPHPSWSSPKQPVTGIRWSQAARYCEAMGKHLPTEVEWEHAARGPGGSLYPWGEEPASCERAVITTEDGPSCGARSSSLELDLGHALEVGSRPPSFRGIHDQVGNASEWVADWYLSDLSGCGEDCSGVAPLGPCGGAPGCELSPLKVVRGGSWAQGPQCITSVRREGYDPNHDMTRYVGFRCAATLEQARVLTDMDYRPLEIQAADALCAARAAPTEATPHSPQSWAATDRGYRRNQGKLLRIVNQSYKSPEMIERLVCHYYERFPKISQAYQVGLSHEGRPILALRVSDRPRDGSGRPAVLFEGGQHGHELLSVDYAVDAMEEIFTNLHLEEVQDWLETFDIWFVPMLNPDGANAILHIDQSNKIGRKNGRDVDGDGRFEVRSEGVDLNRNYPLQWGVRAKASSANASSPIYRGAQPASEPETRTIMRLAESQRFLASISWHTNGTTIISPYNTGGVSNPVPDIARQIALDLKAAAPVQANYRKFKVKSSVSPVDGAEQDWLYFEYGTLAYKVEGSNHNPPDLKTRERSTEGVRPVYRALLERLGEGPSVYGRVLDSSGEPVEALVEIEGFSMNSGERWSSRPSDGFFERVLPSAGSYTFHFTGPDGRRSSRLIKLKSERKQVEIVLGE
jgi:sulfatase modifying factor 1